MLSKGSKLLLSLCAFFTILMAIVICVPFRTLTFITVKENWMSIESGLKFLILPLFALLLTVFPALIKYKQIKEERGRSKVINIMTYLPLLIYAASCSVLVLQTLTFNTVPMDNSVHTILLTLTTSFLVIVLFLISFMNKLTMTYGSIGNLILDGVFFVASILVAIFGKVITTLYYQAFGNGFGFVYGMYNKDYFLLAEYALLFVAICIYSKSMRKLFKRNEVLVNTEITSK